MTTNKAISGASYQSGDLIIRTDRWINTARDDLYLVIGQFRNRFYTGGTGMELWDFRSHELIGIGTESQFWETTRLADAPPPAEGAGGGVSIDRENQQNQQG